MMTSPPLRVLYIDDDTALRRLVQRELERKGCQCEVAPDGESGLARLAQGSIDVVALDQIMPGLDGLETLARIKTVIDSPPPVVFVTASPESRIAVAAMKAGAADYVVKDVEGNFVVLLMVAIDNAVRAERLRHAKEAAEAEVRAARDRFEALAIERAILLREVNHRVGNSLQLIVSLLQIQANASVIEDCKIALAVAITRVVAVAEVHKRLYTSEDVQSVAVDQYLTALVDDLRRTSERGGLSQITLRADSLDLDPDRAVAIGVIVTELVMNALKYAYPNASGPIRIGLQRVNRERVVLSVEDDGIGLNGASPSDSTGLGQKIVHAMAVKLGAEVTQAAVTSGTKVVIAFNAG